MLIHFIRVSYAKASIIIYMKLENIFLTLVNTQENSFVFYTNSVLSLVTNLKHLRLALDSDQKHNRLVSNWSLQSAEKKLSDAICADPNVMLETDILYKFPHFILIVIAIIVCLIVCLFFSLPQALVNFQPVNFTHCCFLLFAC